LDIAAGIIGNFLAIQPECTSLIRVTHYALGSFAMGSIKADNIGIANDIVHVLPAE